MDSAQLFNSEDNANQHNRSTITESKYASLLNTSLQYHLQAPNHPTHSRANSKLSQMYSFTKDALSKKNSQEVEDYATSIHQEIQAMGHELQVPQSNLHEIDSSLRLRHSDDHGSSRRESASEDLMDNMPAHIASFHRIFKDQAPAQTHRFEEACPSANKIDISSLT
jgi:Fe2+ transport system protein B